MVYRGTMRTTPWVVGFLLACPGRAWAADFFVAPDGKPDASGTSQAPWDLQTALSHPPAVQPGDTILLRGGTYAGVFEGKLAGTADARITVRSAPGE